MKYQAHFRIRDSATNIYKRMQIVEGYLNGFNLTKISKYAKCSIKTAKKWVENYKEYLNAKKNSNEENYPKFSPSSAPRKRKLSIPYKVQRYIIKKCSNKSTGGKDGISLNYLLSQINSAPRIRKKLNYYGKISKTTLHNFIKNHFGKCYKLRKKPFLTNEHIQKRKEFANYIISEKINGNNIFFTDEKLFLINFMPNKQTNQIRLTNIMKQKLRKGSEEAEKLLSVEIPKKSKGFMVAGGVSKYGVGKLIFCIGTVDSYAYKQAINYYTKDIKNLSDDALLFQQDNAPSHTSKEIKSVLKKVKCLDFWPPNSPDISPIEKIWSFIMKKLEGLNFDDLEAFKRKVLYIWNRIPPSYCEKIIEKFNEDIQSVKKNGKFIKNRPKSSYKPYNLAKPKYPDIIENIIYNKEKMTKLINKKRKDISNDLDKKRKLIKKLKAKQFYNFVHEKISKKYRAHIDVIQTVFNEELKPYEDEIIDLKEEKERLNKCTLENYFDNLPQKKKEEMISLFPSYRDIETDESSIESLSEKINFIINKPLNELKNKMRFDIRNFITNKIKELKTNTKKRLFKVIK